ncbi:MAG: ATP-binding protein, partial [Pseudomonadota bacterium]
VIERSTGPTREEAQRILSTVEEWRVMGLPENAASWSKENYDLLTELLAADSFIERQSAIDAVDHSLGIAAYSMSFILLSGIGAAALLSATFVRPLSATAVAARRISDGDFDTKLPAVFGTEMKALTSSMSVMQTNIAERVAREEESRQWAEARLGQLIHNAADAVVILNPSSEVVAFNTRAQEIAGEGLQLGASFISALAKSDLSSEAVVALSSGGDVQLPSGAWVHAARPNAGEHGSVIIWSDITALKEREQSLTAANDAKTRFISIMSHELRTPLNSVIGFAQLIRDQAFGPVGDDNYTEFAGEILSSGNNLLVVINDILDFANAQQTDYAANLEPADITSPVSELCAELRKDPALTGKSLETSIADDLPVVKMNTAHMSKALRHLLTNAAEFSPEGSSVYLGISADDSDCIITVRDKGKGMTSKELDRALQVFEQIDGSRNRAHEGIGLGLPLARTIVEAHGGTFEIESQSGKGTEITIRLPHTGGSAHDENPRKVA